MVCAVGDRLAYKIREWSSSKRLVNHKAPWSKGMKYIRHSINLDHFAVINAAVLRQSRRRRSHARSLQAGRIGERRSRTLEQASARPALQRSVRLPIRQGPRTAACHRVRPRSSITEGGGQRRAGSEALGPIHGYDLGCRVPVGRESFSVILDGWRGNPPSI